MEVSKAKDTVTQPIDCTPKTHLENELKSPPDVDDEISETGWAWMVLVGCFISRVLIVGLMTSLGVFVVALQDYFPGSIERISWMGSLVVGLSNLIGPFGSALCKRFSIRQVAFSGSVLTSSSLAAASFVTHLWHLYVCSTFAGIGLGLIYQPSFVIITYYFDRRLAQANGFVSAGAAVGILVFPPLCQALISIYGWRAALLLLATIFFNFAVCAALYRPTTLEVKHKIIIRKSNDPVGDVHHANDSENCIFTDCQSKLICILAKVSNAGDFILLKNVYLVYVIFAYFLNSTGNFLISQYLIARAVHSGTSEINAAYLVSTAGSGSLVSRLGHGYVIDNQLMSATGLTACACVVAGIACAMNPISNSYIILMISSLMMGLGAGVCPSTLPILAKEYAGLKHASGAMGWILFASGMGIILGAYITVVLMDITGSYNVPFITSSLCYILSGILLVAQPLTKWARGVFTNTTNNDLKCEVNKGLQMEVNTI